MKGILDGTGLVIDRFFGVERVGTSTPHYRHKQSCLHLSERPLVELDSLSLFEELYATILANWDRSRLHYHKPPSQENWREARRPEIAQGNKSPEVTLERSIIQVTDNTWINQVPTSSGLVGPRRDKVRNIDLVHDLGEGVWEFIELKVDSDTPLFAAMEIVLYGLLFLFSQRHHQDLGYGSSKRLLQATRVHLKVLAPSHYYTSTRDGEGYQLQWLEESINEGLSRFLGVKLPPASWGASLKCFV